MDEKAEVDDAERLLDGHVACPTCLDARPGRCCTCGEEVGMGDQKLWPDPYSFTIHHDERRHLLCRTCKTRGVLDCFCALDRDEP